MRAISAIFRCSAVARKVSIRFTLILRNDTGIFFFVTNLAKILRSLSIDTEFCVVQTHIDVLVRAKISLERGNKGPSIRKLFTMQKSNQISISLLASLVERTLVSETGHGYGDDGWSFSNLHGTVSIMKAILKHHVHVTRKKEIVHRATYRTLSLILYQPWLCLSN